MSDIYAAASSFTISGSPFEKQGTVFPALYPPFAGLFVVISWQTLAGTGVAIKHASY